MKAEDYLNLFMETGAPEMYLMYHHVRRLENRNVPDNQGIGASDNSLQ